MIPCPYCTCLFEPKPHQVYCSGHCRRQRREAQRLVERHGALGLLGVLELAPRNPGPLSTDEYLMASMGIGGTLRAALRFE